MIKTLWELEPPSGHYGYYESFEFFRKGNDLHDCHAVYFLERGTFEYRIGNGDANTLHAGEAIICPPKTNFSKTVRETVTMHVVCLYLKEDTELTQKKINCSQDKRIAETLLRLRLITLQEQIPAERYRMHLIEDLWYSLCALIEGALTEKPPSKRHSDPIFDEIRAFTDMHPEASLSVIAESFGYSRVTVNKLFRKHTGETAGVYIQKLRIEKACRLLEQTTEPLKAIAPLCGFSNEYYFSSVFRKCTGYTPCEYRKNHYASGG